MNDDPWHSSLVDEAGRLLSAGSALRADYTARGGCPEPRRADFRKPWQTLGKRGKGAAHKRAGAFRRGSAGRRRREDRVPRVRFERTTFALQERCTTTVLTGPRPLSLPEGRRLDKSDASPGSRARSAEAPAFLRDTMVLPRRWPRGGPVVSPHGAPQGAGAPLRCSERLGPADQAARKRRSTASAPSRQTASRAVANSAARRSFCARSP